MNEEKLSRINKIQERVRIYILHQPQNIDEKHNKSKL